ncbi:MAG: 3-oxo-5-alpha-steroid 4-dehydrogenase [Paludibacteraceae bacterium]|nr:3-oxo-5-alpha-steroid 4-dehydrogenase [Paludibacteraceae bacterium]
MEISTALESFYNFLFILFLVGLVVFVALYFVDAGYGKMRSDKWGPAINNKVGWCLMEMPVFVVMLYLWVISDVKFQLPYLVFFLLFQFHYFQRSFIFPFLLKGNSKMPLVIMFFSMVWNLVNGYIQGYWLFHLAPQFAPYAVSWFGDWRFILGVVIFICGWIINMHSDHVIRHLRKPGDTNHYLPKKGMYQFVTSANYLGEITEWLGFAILTWSWAGLTFFWFSCSNLVPRANSIYHKYKQEFASEFDEKRLKRIIPFIY